MRAIKEQALGFTKLLVAKLNIDNVMLQTSVRPLIWWLPRIQAQKIFG